MTDDFRTLLSRAAAKRSSLERCIDTVPPSGAPPP